MSQTEEKESKKKYHKIQIKPCEGAEDQLSVGANTQVLLDGNPIACSFVKFEAKARGVTKVLIEMYATVEAEANINVVEMEDKPTDMTIHGKPVVMRRIGSYLPTVIAEKKK